MNRLAVMGLVSVPIALWLLGERKSNSGTAIYQPNKLPGGLALDPTTPAVVETPMPGQFIASLPAGKTAEEIIARSAMIRDETIRLYKAKQLTAANLQWTEVFTTMGQYSARIPVVADSLFLEGVRVSVSFRAQQQICDALGIYPLTPHVMNLIQIASSLKVLPATAARISDKLGVPNWVENGTMGYTENMLIYSDYVSKLKQEMTDRYFAGELSPVTAWANIPGYNWKLFNNPGKYWVLSQYDWLHANKGTNWGWYDPGAPSSSGNALAGNLWQSLSENHQHFIDHADYSQVFRAMGRAIEITDGVTNQTFSVSMAEALTSPKWAALVSNEGPLREPRHPSIPPYGSTTV